MKALDLFVAFHMALSGESGGSVEDIYSYREGDGEQIYYAAADRSRGVDPRDSSKIDANKKLVWFEVALVSDQASIEVAKDQVSSYSNSGGDSYEVVDSVLTISDKTASDAMAIYRSRGMSGVVLPLEKHIDSGVAWLELQDRYDGSGANAIFHYRKIRNEVCLKIIGSISSEDHSIAQVYNHWQSLVTEYSAQFQ